MLWARPAPDAPDAPDTDHETVSMSGEQRQRARPQTSRVEDIVWGMTKGGPGRASETLTITMYKSSFMMNDYGLGAAVALLLTIVTVTASLLYLRRQLAPAKEF